MVAAVQSDKPRKPPRPAVSPQAYDPDADLLPTTDDTARLPANPVPRPRTTITRTPEPDKNYETVLREMENAAAKSESGERFETVTAEPEAAAATADGKYETVLHEKRNNVRNVELATVAVLNRPGEADGTAKWVDAKLMEQPEQYAEELPGIPASEDRGATSTVLDPGAVTVLPSERRGGGGLKMRVTGEMPKAYSRGEKDSARKAFMLAPPVGIETGSEESDEELSSPRYSSTEPSTAPWDRSEQHVR